MPVKLYEDENTITFLTDDGEERTVAKPVAERIPYEDYGLGEIGLGGDLGAAGPPKQGPGTQYLSPDPTTGLMVPPGPAAAGGAPAPSPAPGVQPPQPPTPDATTGAGPPPSPEFGVPQPTGAFGVMPQQQLQPPQAPPGVTPMPPAPAEPIPLQPGAPQPLTAPEPPLGEPALLEPPGAPPELGPPLPSDIRRLGEIPSTEQYVEEQRRIAEAGKQLTGDIAERQAAEAGEVVAPLETFQAEARRIEGEKTDAYQAATKLYQKKFGDYEAALDTYQTTTVSRGRLWKNMSTGRKVLAAIGVVLGTIGEAVARRDVRATGGQVQGPMKMHALNVLMGAIDQDVQEQRANIEQIGKAAQMKKGALKDFWDLTENKQQAYDLAWAASAKQAQREIELLAQKSKDDEIIANAQLANVTLEEAISDKLKGVRDTEWRERMAEAQFKLQQMAQRGKLVKEGRGGGRGAARGAAENKQGCAQFGISQKLCKFQIWPGGPGTKPIQLGDAAEARGFRDMMGGARALGQIVSGLARAREEFGWEPNSRWWTSDDAQRMLSDYSAAMLEMKDVYKLGAITAADLELIEGALGGDVTARKSMAALLDRTVFNVKRSIQEKLGARNVTTEFRMPIFKAKKKGVDLMQAEKDLMRSRDPDGQLVPVEARMRDMNTVISQQIINPKTGEVDADAWAKDIDKKIKAFGIQMAKTAKAIEKLRGKEDNKSVQEFNKLQQEIGSDWNILRRLEEARKRPPEKAPRVKKPLGPQRVDPLQAPKFGRPGLIY